ncbi:DUF1045 domain-containing protein [uncultured Hoeflea sp.]|uniref:DUF1045 domain-containing protein n=1 Tax=uncultured Hoeflea sp. TaxID=538666 RepID=UPI002623BE1A|nr:DUF1045 domain-containing protein [uncultured Hoeflea sp.]
MRYAIYFAPGPDTELAQLGAGWLGRDAGTGRTIGHSEIEGLGANELAVITGPARRYGFHATLKAPFRLASGVSPADLARAVDAFAARKTGFEIPALRVGIIGGFVAIVPDGQCEALTAFAGEVVEAFEPLRAALSEAEIERRNPDALSSPQLRNLMRWGYPYVFDEFRFHMTLSTRLEPSEAERVREAAAKHFAPALQRPVPVDQLTLFGEAEPGGPFEILRRAPLARAQHRKTG